MAVVVGVAITVVVVAAVAVTSPRFGFLIAGLGAHRAPSLSSGCVLVFDLGDVVECSHRPRFP